MSRRPAKQGDAKQGLPVSIVSAWEIAIKRSLDREETSLCSTRVSIDSLLIRLQYLTPMDYVSYSNGVRINNS